MTRRRQDADRPLYLISVVSQMLEVHPQTLRMYEREGFVTPHRINRQRLYSDRDVEKLHLVIELTKDLGVNKAGVDIILRMRTRIEEMHREISEVMDLVDNDVRRELQRRFRAMLGEE
ncbi:MAG TPA: MerR family transcriptional regulator [Dissulfurispiraceae bacterium]|nr:MerR family transcriptional regulator [Dissulfurispiraceae bacterium]